MTADYRDLAESLVAEGQRIAELELALQRSRDDHQAAVARVQALESQLEQLRSCDGSPDGGPWGEAGAFSPMIPITSADLKAPLDQGEVERLEERALRERAAALADAWMTDAIHYEHRGRDAFDAGEQAASVVLASISNATRRCADDLRAALAVATPAPTKVDQTILHSDPERPGNCFAACIASALGLTLDAVPHFIEWGMKHYGDGAPHPDGNTGAHWHAMMLGFLAGRGLWPVMIASLDQANPGEVVFVGGPSPRNVPHQVLYRDGELWHDPHPSRAGLVRIDDDDLWVIRPAGPHDHTPTRVQP